MKLILFFCVLLIQVSSRAIIRLRVIVALIEYDKKVRYLEIP